MNKIEFYSNLAKFEGRNGDAFLKHYGIIGQKWGQRRWQNADGTFNEEGKQRYFGSKNNSLSDEDKVKIYKEYSRNFLDDKATAKLMKKYKLNANEFDQLKKDARKSIEEERMRNNGYTKHELSEQEIDDYARERAESAMREEFAEENVDRYTTDKEYNEAYEEYKKNNFKDFYEEEKYNIEQDPYEWVKEDKVGGLFNKTPEEKEFKEAKKLIQQLNFNNGTRILKELNNTEYGKKHIQPIYDEYEENMNKLSDKAEKIIKDNPVDETEAGIASAIDHNGGIPNIGYIINNVRRQHHASTVDSFINVDSLPLLKSEEDLYTEAKEYKKEFGENIEKAIKDINPKANITLSSLAALTNYENDKLEKVYNMNGEDYRRYQLYQTINYGLVPEANKEIIRKNIVEPTKKLYPKVEKLFKNTNVGDPTYDWSDIGKALIKLGLDSKPADELTNADWKKVYEICSQ